MEHSADRCESRGTENSTVSEMGRQEAVRTDSQTVQVAVAAIDKTDIACTSTIKQQEDESHA